MMSYHLNVDPWQLWVSLIVRTANDTLEGPDHSAGLSKFGLFYIDYQLSYGGFCHKR